MHLEKGILFAGITIAALTAVLSIGMASSEKGEWEFDEYASLVVGLIEDLGNENLRSMPGPTPFTPKYDDERIALNNIYRKLIIEIGIDSGPCEKTLYADLLEFEDCAYLIVFEALRRYQGNHGLIENYAYVREYVKDVGYSPFENDACMNEKRAGSERFEILIDGYYRLAWVNTACASSKFFLRSRGWVGSDEVEECRHFESDRAPTDTENVIRYLCKPVQTKPTNKVAEQSGHIWTPPPRQA